MKKYTKLSLNYHQMHTLSNLLHLEEQSALFAILSASFESIVCCGPPANSVDPEQIVSIGAVWPVSTMFVIPVPSLGSRTLLWPPCPKLIWITAMFLGITNFRLFTIYFF